jgi:hypothetical protein
MDDNSRTQSGDSGDGPASIGGLAREDAPDSPRERRRFSRVVPPHAVEAELCAICEVALVDVSVGGVSFVSACCLAPAHRARLSTLLGRQPFTASIEVKRTKDVSRGSGTQYLVAAAFTSVDELSAHVLAEFLPRRERRQRPS